MTAPKLTANQQQLVDLLKSGGRVLRTWDYPKQWVCQDTHKRCTNTAESLMLRGVVRVVKAEPPVRFYDGELKLTEAQ